MSNRFINIPIETIYNILLFLPYHDILNFCQAYPELESICQDNRFSGCLKRWLEYIYY